jgi:hypothetical protein
MLKGLINLFRRATKLFLPQQDYVEAQAASAPATSSNKTYLVDSSKPNLVIERAISPKTVLPLRAYGETTGGQPLGSIPQQAAGLKQIVNDSMMYMVERSPKKITRWCAVSTLNLYPRAGKDINAFYDRSSLKFFYFPDNVARKTIYACDSRSVVSHEFGHAFLDILRPDLWSAQAAEIWSFHEAFGDITALITALQYDQLVTLALQETGGDLKKSNCLTQLAAEMGIGLYRLTKGSDGQLPNCLRDMSQKFLYVQPETLPKEGRDDQLINECHSFGRVFSGMFYHLFVAVTEQNKKSGMDNKTAIRSACDTLTRYLLSAVALAPATPRFYRSVCQEMLVADKKAGNKYQQVLSTTFADFKIVKAEIKMLSEVPLEALLANLTDPYEIEEAEGRKTVRVHGTKTIKLSDKLKFGALNHNPLYDVDVELAAQSAYYFDERGILEAEEESVAIDAINSAIDCINNIHNKNLADGSDKALFEVVDGKLVRKQIRCGCNKPNYCIPGSPEYQKPWKPANNGGCVSCGKGKNCQPRSCDCNPEPQPAAPKQGCYTSVKNCGITSYKSTVSYASRRVC